MHNLIMAYKFFKYLTERVSDLGSISLKIDFDFAKAAEHSISMTNSSREYYFHADSDEKIPYSVEEMNEFHALGTLWEYDITGVLTVLGETFNVNLIPNIDLSSGPDFWEYGFDFGISGNTNYWEAEYKTCHSDGELFSEKHFGENALVILNCIKNFSNTVIGKEVE